MGLPPPPHNNQVYWNSRRILRNTARRMHFLPEYFYFYFLFVPAFMCTGKIYILLKKKSTEENSFEQIYYFQHSPRIVSFFLYPSLLLFIIIKLSTQELEIQIGTSVVSNIISATMNPELQT